MLNQSETQTKTINIGHKNVLLICYLSSFLLIAFPLNSLLYILSVFLSLIFFN